MLAEATCLKFFGPAGGRSLRARAPLSGRDMACRDNDFYDAALKQYYSHPGGELQKLSVWNRRAFLIVFFDFLKI